MRVFFFTGVNGGIQLVFLWGERAVESGRVVAQGVETQVKIQDKRGFFRFRDFEEPAYVVGFVTVG